MVLVFMAIYTLDYVVVRRRWDGVVLLTLSVYVLMLIIFIYSYWKQKRAIEREQLLDELLSDEEH
ncbi:MAG: hypothetical protein ICV84_19785 [Flavisolibacter sp.]|nr:hypothetical protein [Flavisolibacter sp.]MBD0297400.1 hypothetical protein [Flavisolibacter sp.]MBD0351821.1 hypothetical protein [Flavisolibacter sp.]